MKTIREMFESWQRNLVAAAFAVALISLAFFWGLSQLTIVFLVSFASFLAFSVMSYRKRRMWYSWDRVESAQLDEWSYIKNVLMLKRDYPLCGKPVWLIDWEGRPAILLLFATPVMALLICAMLLIVVWTIFIIIAEIYGSCLWTVGETDVPFCLSIVNDVVEDSVHPPGIAIPVAALVAATVAGIGVFLQVRQSTRSANRQKWIISIRKLMSSLIAGIPSSKWRLALARTRYRSQYVELALYLNPSENVHRAFLYALAVMYEAQEWQSCPNDKLKCFTRDSQCFASRVQGITRLANVLLKKEWEQVKRLT